MDASVTLQSRHTLLDTAFFWQENQPIPTLHWAAPLIFSSCCNSRLQSELWVIRRGLCRSTCCHFLHLSLSRFPSLFLFIWHTHDLSLSFSPCVCVCLSLFSLSYVPPPWLAAPHTFSLIFFPFASLAAPVQWVIDIPLHLTISLPVFWSFGSSPIPSSLIIITPYSSSTSLFLRK